MSTFPKFQMRHRADRAEPWNIVFLPLGQAGALYDSGWVEVQIGDTVLLDEKGSARVMTLEDGQHAVVVKLECRRVVRQGVPTS